MNKVIRQLIKEMIEGISIDESKNFLSFKKVPGSNRLNDPASDSRVKALKGDFLEKDYDPDEVAVSIDQKYDRYASLFEQISNNPKIFNVGTNVSVNFSTLYFIADNNKISLSRSVRQKELSGNALLKVYGSFDKNKTASPSIENIQNTIQQPDMFLTGSSLAPSDETNAIAEYESIVDEVNKAFGQTNSSLKSTFNRSFKAITGAQQVPSNPHDRLTSVLNSSGISQNLSSKISDLISKTFIDTNNNIFFNILKDMKGFKNSYNIMPNLNRFNIQVLTDPNELNYIFEEVRSAILNTVEADELAKKYPDFFRSLKDKKTLKKSVMSPINFLQQSSKGKPSVSDAMLPFAHAAKDKVTSDVMIQSGFSDKLIDLNVDQFANMIKDFEPEIVIIPGSSSKFNSDYFKKIESLLTTMEIDIVPYSTYKSTHIISFDEQEAKRDQISQLTRGTYTNSFWGATPQGKLSHFIRSIDSGGLKSIVKSFKGTSGTDKALKINTDTIFQELIKESSFPSIKSFLINAVIKKDLDGNIEDSNSNITLANINGLSINVPKQNPDIVFNISIEDFDKFIDISKLFFTNSSDLETARQNLISKKQAATTYFEKNGITQTSGNLIAQISGNAGSGRAYSASVRGIREERIKRMYELQIGAEYEIDKNKKESKTISEMGVVKISEIGSLQQGNQTKRVFLKDMHEVIDDAKLPTALRPLVLDYLNTFASLVYDQMIQNVFDKATIISNLTKEMRNKILTTYDIQSVGVQTPIFDIISGIGTVDAFEVLNPSFKDIQSKFEQEFAKLPEIDQASLEDLRKFIIDDFFASISGLENAVNLSNGTFEEFVEIYKSQIFNLITARDSDFSAAIINDISDLNEAFISQFDDSPTEFGFDLYDSRDVFKKFRDSVKEEYNTIYKVAEEKAKSAELSQSSDLQEIVAAFLNESTDDSVVSIVFDKIISAIGESEDSEQMKEALELFMLGDSDELEALIDLYQEEDEDSEMLKVIKDATDAGLSFLNDIESKKVEVYSAQDNRHKQIMESMISSDFLAKCIAVIMNSFVAQAFKEYLNSPGDTQSFSSELTQLIKNNGSFKNAINQSLSETCLYAVNVNTDGGSIKLQITPKIDLLNQKLIFSAFSETVTEDKFSFKVGFNLSEFLNTENNINRLNKIMDEISKEFAGVGFNRPKNILLLDDNVSSGGTFGLIAKNILKMQSNNNCYFLFDDIDSSLTTYQGNLQNFNLNSVKSGTNKCLTHIIGLTPIFI